MKNNFVLKGALLASVLAVANFSFAQSSTVSVGAPPATTGSTISVSQDTAKSEVKASKWSNSAYIGNAANLKKAESNSNVSDTDLFLERKRNIGNGQSLGLRINARRYSQVDEKGKSLKNDDRLMIGDPQIMYRNKIMASTVRLSIPAWEWSRELGRQELRYNGGLDLYKSGAFTASLTLEERFYHYWRENDGQYKMRADNGFAFTYEINEFVSPFLNVSYNLKWLNDGIPLSSKSLSRDKEDPENLNRSYVSEIGSTFKLKQLTLSTYLSQEKKYGSNTQWFDNDDTSYVIEALASF